MRTGTIKLQVKIIYWASLEHLIRPKQQRKICWFDHLNVIDLYLNILYDIYFINNFSIKSIRKRSCSSTGRAMNLNLWMLCTEKKMLGCFSLWLGKIWTDSTVWVYINLRWVVYGRGLVENECFQSSLIQRLGLFVLASKEFMLGNACNIIFNYKSLNLCVKKHFRL